MNFGLTEEQQILSNVARRFIEERANIPKVRDVMESPEAFDDKLWSEMAGLGWFGLTIDEAHGGAGLGFVDLAVLLEETGRGLLPGPLLSTSLAAAAISEFGSNEQKLRYLPSLADGSAIGTLALLEASDSLGADELIPQRRVLPQRIGNVELLDAAGARAARLGAFFVDDRRPPVECHQLRGDQPHDAR